VLLLLHVELPAEARWLEALLPVLAAATSVVALGRRLPFQNVLVAATVIIGLSTAIVAVGALSGVPFGPVVYSDDFAERLFAAVPWPMPLLWVALVINGRGVARLIMRPWRKTNFYGYWVIGLACLLAVLFDLGLEPFAVQVKGWWIWLSGKSVLSWHTAPWVNCLGWFSTNLMDIGVYMADAQVQQLPLVTAEGGGGDIGHDWEFLFSHLGLLRGCEAIGFLTRQAANLAMRAALGLAGWLMIRMHRTPAESP
jgi:uncharacterized membrane protein